MSILDLNECSEKKNSQKSLEGIFSFWIYICQTCIFLLIFCLFQQTSSTDIHCRKRPGSDSSTTKRSITVESIMGPRKWPVPCHSRRDTLNNPHYLMAMISEDWTKDVGWFYRARNPQKYNYIKVKIESLLKKIRNVF